MLRPSWNILLRSASALGVFGIAISAAALPPLAIPIASETHSREAAAAHLARDYGRLPMSFESNQGQASTSVRFLARGQGYGLYLTSDEAVLTLHKTGTRGVPRSRRMARFGHSPELLGSSIPGKNTPNGRIGAESATAMSDLVRMRLAGANSELNPVGTEPLQGIANYIVGNDPAKWHTSVPTFARVRYASVYPGVDLVYYGNQRQLEYDFVVAPGADPKPIQLHFDGAKALKLDGAGNLIIVTDDGKVAFQKPMVYQMSGAVRQSVEGHFQLLGDNTAGFALGSYDRTKPLVIDPVLTYATYLGGSTEDFAVSIAVDAAGEAYVTGLTWSVDFPVPQGAFQTANLATSTNDVSTAFISKLNASGTALLYSTYLGGSDVPNAENGQGEYGHSIAVDSNGNAYVTGWTYSSNFPVTSGAYQTTNKAFPTSEATGFVTKLNANGTGLVYSTYLGGSTLDEPTSLALDSAGNAYTTGYTFSADYPTTPGAFQTGNHSLASGAWNAFVSKLNPTGSALVYSTYLGGSGEDGSTIDGNYALIQVAVDAAGDAYVAGFAASRDFPVTSGVLQPSNNAPAAAGTNPAGTNITLSKLNSTGSGLLYSTFLGGGTGDFSEGLAVDSLGNAYVTGYTYSSDFPVTSGAFQGTDKGAANGANTAFAAEINPTATALVYSTFLGGSGGDDAYGLALDSSGNLYLTGTTMSSDFPVSHSALQSANHSTAGPDGCGSAFLTELNAGGNMVYSTYLGGSGEDCGYQVAAQSNGAVYLAGSTSSSDFPVTTGAFDTRYNSAFNTAFVAQFNFGTTPVPAASVTALTTSASSQFWGDAVSFTAAVAPVSGTGIPTGNVVFSVDEVPVATVLLDSTSKAIYSTSGLAEGEHYILASYAGDATYASSGNGLTETIAPSQVPAPVFSPAAGTYGSAQSVTLTDALTGAVIYYTTDGSIPTVTSAKYTAPITVSSTETLEAVAQAANYPVSPVATAAYTITFAGSPISLSPSSVTAGGAGFTLTVNGTNFVSGATVDWGGTALTTTYVTPSQLTASVPASLIATAGAVSVTVTTSGVTSAATFTIAEPILPVALLFVPMPPCRLVDTRLATGPFGGPSIPGQTSRSFAIPSSACGVPSTAAAYSINVTAVPHAGLAYMTVWPTGVTQPVVSILNSDGRVKANAAIIPAGTGGAISVYATDATDLVLDINGYFVPASTPSALAFYPLTPCRVVDTRNNGSSGLLGGPSLVGMQSRAFLIQSSTCNIPSTAQAYSLNFTAVPQAGLGYLSAWPTGLAWPGVSTLNVSPGNPVVANAAIVPAGTGGAINVLGSNNTDVVIDINGYFAPMGSAAGGQALYTVTPCRALDTRTSSGSFNGMLPVNVTGSFCGIPSTAEAFVLNATVVPTGGLGYLTLWPENEAQPVVSTLNADDGVIASNMAIVPTTNGSIDAFSSSATQLILDISGYFAPSSSGSPALTVTAKSAANGGDTVVLRTLPNSVRLAFHKQSMPAVIPWRCAPATRGRQRPVYRTALSRAAIIPLRRTRNRQRPTLESSSFGAPNQGAPCSWLPAPELLRPALGHWPLF